MHKDLSKLCIHDTAGNTVDRFTFLPLDSFKKILTATMVFRFRITIHPSDAAQRFI